jgi:hypothetical protein
LVQESKAALANLGANNQLRAEFISELAKVVVQDDQPILCQQRPKVRPVQDKYWKYAFTLARDYLRENDLKLTDETAAVEFPDFTNQYSGLTSASSSERIQQVLEVQEEQTFSDRVEGNIAGKPGRGVGVVPDEPAVSKGPEPAPARLTKRRSAPNDGEKPPTPKGKGKKTTKGAPAKGKTATAKITPVKPQPRIDPATLSSGSDLGD